MLWVACFELYMTHEKNAIFLVKCFVTKPHVLVYNCSHFISTAAQYFNGWMCHFCFLFFFFSSLYCWCPFELFPHLSLYNQCCWSIFQSHLLYTYQVLLQALHSEIELLGCQGWTFSTWQVNAKQFLKWLYQFTHLLAAHKASSPYLLIFFLPSSSITGLLMGSHFLWY